LTVKQVGYLIASVRARKLLACDRLATGIIRTGDKRLRTHFWLDRLRANGPR